MQYPVGHRATQILFLLVVSVFSASCGKKALKQDGALPGAAQTAAAAAFTAEDGEANETEASLRDKDYAPETGIHTVYFDFDTAELKTETRRLLQENAAALKTRTGVEIQMAGHCDERGTTGYNLALSQRRATMVRNYYKYLGVKINRMSTIGYGDEKPGCPESAEECWARNRRVETLVKTR